MNESWAMNIPGHSLIGMRVRLLSSRVRAPFQPGSTKPAVAWTMSPRRPSEDFPSTRDTTSSPSSTHSSVVARQNSPGWMTNGSSSSRVTSSVRSRGGSRRSIVVALWLWKTRNELPRRTSTLAGWTFASSHGSMTILPASTNSMMLPSERTLARDASLTARIVSGRALATAVRLRPHARRRRHGGIAVRAAAARLGAARRLPMGVHTAASIAPILVAALRFLADGPPDDVEQHGDRDLQYEHEPYEAPGHVAAIVPLPPPAFTPHRPAW